jgi:hypothetical protein
MRRLDLARDIMVLYAFAAFSCSDNASDTADRGKVGVDAGPTRDSGAMDSGETGRDAGPPRDSGSSGTAGHGPEVCDRQYEPLQSMQCVGSWPDGPGSCRARYERVRCYVTDGPGGDATCLPPTDDNLSALLYLPIGSVGFRSQFVIDAIPPGTIPDECAALVECCRHVQGDTGREACFDLLAGPDFSACHSSAAGEPRQSCANIVPPPNADADGGEPSTVHKSPCCYRLCGYTHSS